MKKILFILIAVLFIIAGSCEREREASLPQDDSSLVSFSNGDVIPGQYVVLLKDGTTSIKSAKLGYADAQIAMLSEIPKILKASDIVAREPIHVYASSVEGFALKLSPDEASSLAKNPGVRGVWPDRMVVLAKPVSPPVTQPAQVTPPGINIVGGPTNSTGKKAWIIDTGCDLNHPDLIVNTALARTFVTRTTTAEDDNGHGTHCAGIVAAINNNIGVVGVAAGATVVPVKVLDKRGSGAYSTIIAGVNYVAGAATAGDAVNMSLGGGVYEPIDLAVIAMAEKGLFVALAAGNESDDANNHSPARANHANIFTISACDNSKVWASFSNYGNPPVDYCAPGVSIYSTYKGDAYATMSGTSMAAPHACGVLLVTGGNPDSDGFVINDPDGNPDPIIHN